MSSDNEKPSETSKVSRDKKVQRDFVKEFVDGPSRIAVRVQRTATFRPYYSIVIGRFVMHENGETFVPYLPVRADVELAKLKTIQDHSKLVASLITDATEYISERVQQREDEIITEQQAREMREEPKSSQRPGLKQLGKIDRIAKNYNS